MLESIDTIIDDIMINQNDSIFMLLALNTVTEYYVIMFSPL